MSQLQQLQHQLKLFTPDTLTHQRCLHDNTLMRAPEENTHVGFGYDTNERVDQRSGSNCPQTFDHTTVRRLHTHLLAFMTPNGDGTPTRTSADDGQEQVTLQVANVEAGQRSNVLITDRS